LEQWYFYPLIKNTNGNNDVLIMFTKVSLFIFGYNQF